MRNGFRVVDSDIHLFEPATLWEEYLDAGRLQSASFSRQLQLLYQSKYENVDLDLVITSDRKALDFLIDNRNQIAPGVPASSYCVHLASSSDLAVSVSDLPSDMRPISGG